VESGIAPSREPRVKLEMPRQRRIHLVRKRPCGQEAEDAIFLRTLQLLFEADAIGDVLHQEKSFDDRRQGPASSAAGCRRIDHQPARIVTSVGVAER